MCGVCIDYKTSHNIVLSHVRLYARIYYSFSTAAKPGVRYTEDSHICRILLLYMGGGEGAQSYFGAFGLKVIFLL